MVDMEDTVVELSQEKIQQRLTDQLHMLQDGLLKTYAIGVAKPVSIVVDTFGTGRISDDKIVEIVEKIFDLRPGAIIKDLELRRPIYRQTAAYGHFGRTDIDAPWEKLNKVEEIKKYL